MHRIILMLLLAVVSSNAVAEWVVVDRTPAGYAASAPFVLYADSSTIFKDGNISKILFLSDYKSPQYSNPHLNRKPYQSIKIQAEIDCEKNKTVSFLHLPTLKEWAEAKL
jgi:hypothetical protein